MVLVRSIVRAAAAGLVALGSGATSAATFGVSPMRIDLAPGQPTAVVTVTNDGDQPLTMQASARRWSQASGSDDYAETRDVILNPAVFTIAPHRRQLLRVAMRAPVDARTERSYRLFITEVPQADEAAKPGTTMRVAIQMNLPLYVAPVAKSEPVADVSGEVDATGLARIVIRNDGNAHLRLTAVKAVSGSETLIEVPVFVVLPGATRSIELPNKRFSRGDTVTLQAEGNAGPLDVPVALARP